MAERIGIIGAGYHLPAKIRSNDDPIFDWLKHNHPAGLDLFFGYNRRHVLADNETALDILLPAARMALDDAGVTPAQIDHVIGCVSPNGFVVPVDLFALANRLGLPETTLTIPIGNDFSNFNVAVVLADALLRAGRASNVLVAVAGGWTRCVDYHTPQAASVADGAACVVMSRNATPRWVLVDSEVITREANFGEMALFGDRRQAATPDDPAGQDFSGPYFHIDDLGLKNFAAFGGGTALLAATRLRDRQGIPAADITVIGHQVSEALLQSWGKTLAPSMVFETLAELANMTVANIPVNFCLLETQAATPYIMALSLAPDMHAHAMLLRRS